MADDPNQVAVEIVAKNKTKEGLSEAAKDVRASAQDIAGGFDEASAAAGDSGLGGVIENLSGKLREHRSEHVQAARSARFFTNELAEIAGKGNIASQALGTLAGGLAAGGALGLAFAAAKIALHVLSEELTSVKVGHQFAAEAADRHAEALGKLTTEINKQNEALGIATDRVRLHGKESTEVSAIKSRESGEAAKRKLDELTAELEAYEKGNEIGRQRQYAMAREILETKNYSSAAQEEIDKLADRVRVGEVKAGRLKEEIALQEKLVESINWTTESLEDEAEAEQKTKTEKKESKKEDQDEKKQEAKFVRMEAAADAWRERERVRELADAEARSGAILSLENRIAITKSQIQDEQRKMMVEHEAEAIKANEEAEKVSLQKTQAEFRSYAAAISGQLNNMFNLIIDKTHTVQQKFMILLEDIGKALIQSLISAGMKRLTEWLIEHAALAAKNVAAVISNAAVAGSAASASAGAGGPVVAVAAGTATMMAVNAAFGPLAAASHGFDVPVGLNPLTQLHSQEMVLPADLANPLRESLTRGGNAGPEVHVHLSAIDGQSVRTFVGSQDFVLAMREAIRNGSL